MANEHCKPCNKQQSSQKCDLVVQVDCIACQSYKRLAREAQDASSSRHQVIEMLQNEVKKIESLYRNLIDDYEKLRYQHCCALQELSSIKTTYHKLEEDNERYCRDKRLADNEIDRLRKEIEKWRNLHKQLQAELDDVSNTKCTECGKSPKKEMKNLEDTIREQNKSLRNLLLKLAEELHNSHRCGSTNDAKGDIKSKEDLIEHVKQLESEIQHYNDIVARLQEENRQFKNNLIKKKSDLSQALGSLEKSNMDISNLSQNIEGIVQERDQYAKKVVLLNEELQKKKLELQQVNQKHDDLTQAYEDRKMALAKCKQQLQEKTAELEILPPMVLNGPEELKSEIDRTRRQVFVKEQQIVDLKSKLEHMQGQVKQFQDSFRNKELDIKRKDEKIDVLHPKLEQLDRKSKFAGPERRCCGFAHDEISQTQEDHNALVNKYEASLRENKTLNDTISDLKHQIQDLNIHYEKAIVKLNKNSQEMITKLEAELKEIKDENVEYEEENKHFSQQLEAMMEKIELLQQEKEALQVDKTQCMQEITRTRNEYKDVIYEKDQEMKHLSDEMKSARDVQEVVKAEATAFKRQSLQLENERDKLYEDNIKLTAELKHLRGELDCAVNKTDVNCKSLQGKLELLERTVKEKEKELDNACHELEKIQLYLKQCVCKTSLGEADETSRLTNENKMLSEKINALQDEVGRYKARFENCMCIDNVKQNTLKGSDDLVKLQADNKKLINDKSQFEKAVKQLHAELCQKNCIIYSLEQCIDKTNKILADCEREIKELHCQRDCMKRNLEMFEVELDKNNYEIAAHKSDKEALQNQIHSLVQMNQQLGKDNMQYAKHDQNQCEIEKKICRLCEDYNTLLRDFKEKNFELDKIKEQFEVLQQCCKTPFIHRDEFRKLKSASKEIKSILTSQSKRSCSCHVEAKVPECTKCLTAPEGGARTQEIDCKDLQNKNNALSTEIIIMKRYVHDILIDNNNLKQAIVNLLTTVINKLKVLESRGDLSTVRAETVVKETLEALTSLEKKLKESTKPSCCPIPKCSCMKEISSSYSNRIAESGDKECSCSPEESVKVTEEPKTEPVVESEPKCPKCAPEGSAWYCRHGETCNCSLE